MTKQEITCPKCSYKFALDQALNREIELHMRKQLSEEFERKESDLRQQLAKEAAEKTERNSAELQMKVEAQAKELKEARDNERALLRTKAELQEQAEKAELEAQRKLSDERDKIRKAAQDQVIEEHRLKDADKNKQLEDMRRQIEDLKRKSEQGSQKLQGDVQEIELEKALARTISAGPDRIGEKWRSRRGCPAKSNKRFWSALRDDPVGIQASPELERQMDRQTD